MVARGSPRGAVIGLAGAFVVAAATSCGARSALDVDDPGFEGRGPLGSAADGAAGGERVDDATTDAPRSGDATAPDATARDAAADARGTPRDCLDTCKPGESECVGTRMSSCIATVQGCWEWDTPVTCVANGTCVAEGGIAWCTPIVTPRALSPLSTSTSTSQRPDFRWALGDGDDGAQVEICADRACARTVTTFVASGGSGSPAAPLPSGVYFWRLRGTEGGTVGRDASAVWELRVGPRDAPVAASWGTMLDPDGDGLADVLIGSPLAGGVSSPGAVRIYAGSTAGLSATPASLDAPDGADGTFGAAVASAGDVNGDGYDDVVVGAPGQFAEGGSSFLISSSTYAASMYAGAVYVYLGGPAWTMATPTRLDSPAGAFSLFGCSVASAGDVNGDGYADIVVGAHDFQEGLGAAFVYLGGPDGIASTPIQIPSPAGMYSEFGSSVTGAGDLDGDGLDDVAITGANHVYVYAGERGGIAQSPTTTLSPPPKNGLAAAAVGDLNGDGYLDIVAGAVFAFSTNTAFVYLGGAAGLSSTPVALTAANTDQYSTWVATGDMNGDGFTDLALSAGFYGGPPTPTAYVYFGGDAGPSGAPVMLTTGDGPSYVVGLGGDVDGDGIDDLVVGGWKRAYVYPGTPTGPAASPVVLTGSSGGAVDSYFGNADVR